ncbi:MAG: UDP-2,3-diacylglucosamine diphosphatase, partial [Acidithiobacillus sp.]
DAIHRALAGSIGTSHQEPPFAILIHGHTHRPLWEERTNGRRMVLGAWTPQVAAIGRWQAGIWSLETLSYPL